MAQNEAQKMQEQMGVVKEVVLKYPVRLADGTLLEKIRIRRPKVGDLRAVSRIQGSTESETETLQSFEMIARLTGMVTEDLDMLDSADFMALGECLREFTGN